VENSKGDIVLFLDSDVVLEKNFIEEVLRVFKERPDAIGVAGYITNIRIERGLKGALRNLLALCSAHTTGILRIDADSWNIQVRSREL
jgi:cellulose synthase/poly-beta-1,6-N-acetylglucosamine synthase-like glycosyltransferase